MRVTDARPKNVSNTEQDPRKAMPDASYFQMGDILVHSPTRDVGHIESTPLAIALLRKLSAL